VLRNQWATKVQFGFMFTFWIQPEVITYELKIIQVPASQR
jgi:hypothetical protein